MFWGIFQIAVVVSLGIHAWAGNIEPEDFYLNKNRYEKVNLKLPSGEIIRTSALAENQRLRGVMQIQLNTIERELRRLPNGNASLRFMMRETLDAPEFDFADHPVYAFSDVLRIQSERKYPEGARSYTIYSVEGLHKLPATIFDFIDEIRGDITALKVNPWGFLMRVRSGERLSHSIWQRVEALKELFLFYSYKAQSTNFNYLLDYYSYYNYFYVRRTLMVGQDRPQYVYSRLTPVEKALVTLEQVAYDFSTIAEKQIDIIEKFDWVHSSVDRHITDLEENGKTWVYRPSNQVFGAPQISPEMVYISSILQPGAELEAIKSIRIPMDHRNSAIDFKWSGSVGNLSKGILGQLPNLKRATILGHDSSDRITVEKSGFSRANQDISVSIIAGGGDDRVIYTNYGGVSGQETGGAVDFIDLGPGADELEFNFSSYNINQKAIIKAGHSDGRDILRSLNGFSHVNLVEGGNVLVERSSRFHLNCIAGQKISKIVSHVSFEEQRPISYRPSIYSPVVHQPYEMSQSNFYIEVFFNNGAKFRFKDSLYVSVSNLSEGFGNKLKIIENGLALPFKINKNCFFARFQSKVHHTRKDNFSLIDFKVKKKVKFTDKNPQWKRFFQKQVRTIEF